MVDIVPLSPDQRDRLDALQMRARRRGDIRVVGAIRSYAGSRLYPVIQFGPDDESLERLDQTGHFRKLSMIDIDLIHDRKVEVAWLLKEMQDQPRIQPSPQTGFGADNSCMAA